MAWRTVRIKDGCCRPDESVHISKMRFSQTLWRRRSKTLPPLEWILQKTGVVLLIFLILDRRNADGMGRSRSATGSRFVRMSAYIWGMST